MTPRVTLESLAMMVKEGFEDMGKQFTVVHKEIDGIKSDIERIDLRLSQAAYRFEVVELEQRVDYVEHRLGIPRR